MEGLKSGKYFYNVKKKQPFDNVYQILIIVKWYSKYCQVVFYLLITAKWKRYGKNLLVFFFANNNNILQRTSQQKGNSESGARNIS